MLAGWEGQNVMLSYALQPTTTVLKQAGVRVPLMAGFAHVCDHTNTWTYVARPTLFPSMSGRPLLGCSHPVAGGSQSGHHP